MLPTLCVRKTMSKFAHPSHLGNLDLLEFSSKLQKQYETSGSGTDRKGKGQFFTPLAISRFMAGLFSSFPTEFKLLDPGAGIGTLTAAVCERVLCIQSPCHLDVHLFEIDQTVIPLLNENMEHCHRVLQRTGRTMSYTIHHSDFILSNSGFFEQELLLNDTSRLGEFDAVIMNPPYFKINKESLHARMMSSIIHGQPNIYALFMALATKMLRPGGEFVAITPRSFCNGPYFRDFRRWFFERMSLRHIHLFESRAQTFQEANVLQESLITVAQSLDRSSSIIKVTTSFGPDLTNGLNSRDVPANRIIDNTRGDMVVRIPENPMDVEIMDFIEAWPTRFVELGLLVSTGPVVMFRAREFLHDNLDIANTAPFLSVHNVKPFNTIWPLPKNNKPVALKVCSDSLRLLVPTRNYILVRRFSAKEERRRLTASCFLRSSESRPYIALENHLNYIYHVQRELAEDETYGITALFNSALLDRYFRAISGNTQVNATEIRNMKFPDLATIARIGRLIKKLSELQTEKVEEIVLSELGVNDKLKRYLMEFIL